MSELYKRISDGKVGFDELEAAVEAATSEGGQFYNGMLEASQTVNGRLSTLQDNISALVGKLTNDLFTAFGDIIGKSNELVVAFLDDDEKMARLKETIGLTAAVVVSAGAAFLAYKGYIAATSTAAVVQTTVTTALAAAHKAAEGGAKGLALAQAALNTVMTANPIGLVVSALAALTAGLVTAYNTSETFRNIVNGAFQSVASIAQSAIGTAIGWLDQLSYKLNSALGKNGYTGYASYDDYKSAKTSQENRDQRHQAALSGEGISNKSWTQRQDEAKAAANAAQSAEKVITASANKATSSTQKAGSSATKTASEVVKSITKSVAEVDGNITRTTETVNETLKNGTTQQKKTVTETSRQIVDGILSDVKTITTTAADGSQKVTQSIEAVRDVVSTTKATQTALVDGAKVTVEKTTELLADGSEKVSTVTTRTGKEIIDGVERTVKTVTTKTADGVETTVRTIEDAGVQYASAGELLTTQLRDKLNDGWDAIQEDIQTDAFGAIESLATALKNGDLEKLGLWAASYFWHACTAEQQTQIQSLAMGALNQLSAALNNVGSNLASLAMSFVAKFVPAAASATAGQTALNIAMDANPIGLVISLIGLLVGALINFAGTNESVANGFKKVWYGVEDVVSFVFESILRVLGLGVQGFVDAVNAVIDTYNWVADKLGLDTISRVSNPLWDAADKIADRRKQRQEERNNSSSSSADSSSDSSSAPSTPKDPDPTPDNTDAIEDNTAAILAANEKLAEMVRQADGLVLSDNMAVTRTVAASGTAQVAAAANNYHREGDTNITQNIYSKAQTAADLQREARWEADRAKATKR